MTHRHRHRRSTVEGIVRGGLALLALVLGYVSVTHSLADLVKYRDPARAHVLAPGDGRVTALLAERTIADDAASNAQTSAVRLATLALYQDPTVVSAVATLGLAAGLRGDMPAARRLFGYSQMLSRRHLPTQLWVVEDAVARGDVREALQHYDIALRTSKSAPDLLFPILTTAISDPVVRSSLIMTLARRPPWALDFIIYAATNRNDPRATAALFLGMRQARLPVPEGAGARLVDRLIEAGAVSTAWSYYKITHPGTDPRRSRDPYFAANLQSPSRFDWVPVDDGGSSSSMQRAGEHGIFDFAVPAGAGGTLLRQMQVLPAGAYRLEGRGSGIQGASNALPYWSLVCADGRELGRVTMVNSSENEGTFAGRLDVPPTCSVQTLSLVAPSSSEAGGLTGQIVHAQLTPLAAERQ